VKIPRMYTGEDGRSHFDEVEIDLIERGHGGVSELFDGPGVIFRHTAGDYDLDFHPAPRRQLVVNLDGWLELELGDGTVRRFGPGSLFLADDTTGQGHRSRAVDGQPRHSLFVPIDGEIG
jgi:hypothetical protein